MTVVREVEERAERHTSTRLAARQVVADEARAEAERKRRVRVAAEKLALKVWNADEEVTRGALRTAMRSYRDDFDEALAHARAADWVVVAEEPGQGQPKCVVRPGGRRPEGVEAVEVPSPRDA